MKKKTAKPGSVKVKDLTPVKDDSVTAGSSRKVGVSIHKVKIE
jgi:hypothetical protein